MKFQHDFNSRFGRHDCLATNHASALTRCAASGAGVGAKHGTSINQREEKMMNGIMGTSSRRNRGVHLFAWVFLAMAWSGTVQAGANAYSNITVTGPTYDRVQAFNCSVDAVYDDVTYHMQPFTVSTSGSYTIYSDQNGSDGVIFLYAVGFDPTDPAINCMAANDDSTGVGFSAITTSLVAGTEYLLVTTEFAASGGLVFTNTLTGPGEIVFGVRYTGALYSSGAVFDRPNFACNDQNIDDVGYSKQPFVVDADGIYRFTSVQKLFGSTFRGNLFLYTGAFNDSQPLAECTDGNGAGFNGNGTSNLSAQLYAGVQYVLVTAGYDSTDNGDFVNTIAGPGHVAPGGVVYSGSTVDGPTFVRPTESCAPTTAVVRYSSQLFYASEDSTGAIDYELGSTQDYDGYLHLYQPSFDDDDPTQDCIRGNDDAYSGIGTSLIYSPFGAPLADYSEYLVTSAYEYVETGHFVNYIAPPTGAFVALGDESYVYQGTTTGHIAANRPNANAGCQTYSGEFAPVSAFQFQVSQSGNYKLESTQAPGFDGYLLLYEYEFPFYPGTVNCLGGNDDGPDGVGYSTYFAAPLKAYRDYVLVTTGYSSTDSGDFVNSIVGPGSVIVPSDGIFADGFE